jgi:hypothetical protein
VKRSIYLSIATLISSALLSTNLISVASAATKTTVSFNVTTTPSAGESIVTFYGQVKPAANAAITIKQYFKILIAISFFLFFIVGHFNNLANNRECTPEYSKQS